MTSVEKETPGDIHFNKLADCKVQYTRQENESIAGQTSQKFHCNSSSTTDSIEEVSDMNNPLEGMPQKGNSLELDKSPDHQSECPEFPMDDHDIASCSLDAETKPVQCTEDKPQEDVESNSSSLTHDGCQRSQVQVINEDIDLPHNASEKTSSEITSSYKSLRLNVVNTGTNSEGLIDEEELKVECREENTNKKLSASSQDEHDDSVTSPLEISRYLKTTFRQRTRSVYLHVYMLRSPSEQANFVLTNKQPASNSSLKRQYNTELNRLATYINYPLDLSVFAVTLAGDGFIYKHDEHMIECNFCKLRIDLSELSRPDANPVRLHWERCPQCPLKQGLDCGNTPFPKVNENSNTPSDQSTSSDSQRADVKPMSLPSNGYVSTICDGKSADTSYQYQAGQATVLPSPLVHQQPSQSTYVTDSVPSIEQVQPPSIPPRGNSDSTLSQTRPQQPNPSSITSAVRHADSAQQQQELVAGRANGNKDKNSSAASGNRPSSPPSTSSQKGATASAAASQPKSAKSSKKGKASKKSETSNTKTGAAANGSSAEDSSSKSNTSSQNSSSKTNTSSGDKAEPQQKKLTYADLGIFADKPKRPEMAVTNKRLKSYEEKWKSSFKKTPEELVECGMYYAGYADCARCFFCGGGLKNWETVDEPWVEHARWFPKCAYVRLCKGPLFVEIVQRKNRDKEKIFMKDIKEEISRKSKSPSGDEPRLPVNVNTSGPNDGQLNTASTNKLAADISTLEKENEELQAQVACKICMDEKSSVVFLPCGHMVACTSCSIVLKNCPLCRSEIKGSVRAHMG